MVSRILPGHCTVSIPLRGKGKGKHQEILEAISSLVTEVSIPLRGKGKGKQMAHEVRGACGGHVSIPLRGKGKGKPLQFFLVRERAKFPSPYGEKVKERVRLRSLTGTGLQTTNRRTP